MLSIVTWLIFQACFADGSCDTVQERLYGVTLTQCQMMVGSLETERYIAQSPLGYTRHTPFKCEEVKPTH